MTDELIERVARAIHQELRASEGPWESDYIGTKSNCRDMARAAISAIGEPEVKALEWEYDSGWHEASSETGCYEIQGAPDDGPFMFSHRQRFCRIVFETLEEAKAAAQAHYAAAIRSALVSEPSTAQDENKE